MIHSQCCNCPPNAPLSSSFRQRGTPDNRDFPLQSAQVSILFPTLQGHSGIEELLKDMYRYPLGTAADHGLTVPPSLRKFLAVPWWFSSSL